MAIHKKILLMCLIMAGSLFLFLPKANAATEYSCYCAKMMTCFDADENYKATCVADTSCIFAKVTCKNAKLVPGTLIQLVPSGHSAGTAAVPVGAPAGMMGTSGLASFIPDCTNLDNCRDISVFLIAAIGVGKYLFSIIGALALVFFIYGGIMLIISQGNSERVKKGFQILMSAFIGLAIAFSAYMLVRFIGEKIVPIKSQYQITVPAITPAVK
ncbi:MAG: pilin [bacterium]